MTPEPALCVNDLILILVATVPNHVDKRDIYRLAKKIDDELKLNLGIKSLFTGDLYSPQVEGALTHNVALGLMVHKSCYDGSKRWHEYQITDDGMKIVVTKPAMPVVLEMVRRQRCSCERPSQ